MNAIYDLSDGRRLMLYEENNRIMVLFTPLRRGNMPSLRHSDCLGKLFSTLYNGKIYYVYENFSHQIAFSCMEASTFTILLSPCVSFLEYERLFLKEISGKLYLFYQVCTGDGIYELYMMDPWKNEESRCIFKGGSQRLDCRWYVHGSQQFLAIDVQGQCLALYVWNVEKRCYLLWTAPCTTKTREEETARLKAEKQRLEEELACTKAENKDLHEAMKHLKAQESCLQQQLKSAKQQYDALADMAKELQKLGRLWRDKYFETKQKNGH